MTDHADTIRRALDLVPFDQENPRMDALAALAAFLAERQQAIDALRGIAGDTQRTVAGLQGWARAALVSLGETE